MTRPPRFFDWLLRRLLPAGREGDSIRGDLLEELHESGGRQGARLRYRAHVLSIVSKYAFRRAPRDGAERRKTMEATVQNVKFALRSLTKRPAFALIVVTTLALGIGANTAIFSILNALVLRSLPVSEPDRLVVVSVNQLSLPYPLFRYFQEHSKTLEGVLAFRTLPVRFTSDGSSERITGALVSGTFFEVLGVAATVGTTIHAEDDMVRGSGGPRGPVVVLSHGFWQRRFGGRSDAIGEPIVLNGRPFTIVGVAASRFEGTEVGQSPDVFAPMAMQPVLMPSGGNPLEQPRNNWLRIIGRVKRGVEVQQAEAELTSQLQTYIGEVVKERDLRNLRVTLLPGSAGISGLRTRYSRPLTVVMAVMVLVLLIACANIANLSLGRAAARQREIAIRLSMGASRARVMGQLLTESLLLAAAGGTAGLFLARWGRDALLTYVPVSESLAAPLDRSVLLFTMCVTVAAAVLFGLAPAWAGTRVNVAPVLKDGPLARSSPARFRRGLVIFQVSVSLVVIVGAALFTRSLNVLLTTETGFSRQNVLVANVDLPTERSVDVYPRLLEQLKQLPGVLSAAAADSAPLGTNMGWNIYVPGYVPTPNEPRLSPWVNVVSPAYFETMMVPVLLGRGFDERDASENRNVMVVNETFAKHYFGGENPIGRRVGLSKGIYDIEIVGVVRDSKYTGLRQDRVRAVYVPFRPGPWASTVTVHLRTAGDPTSLASALRPIVREVDPHTSVSNIRTVEDEIGRSLLRERLVAKITMLVGGLALALAVVGLYGVLSYAVAQRTRELGIRMAVGATTGMIRWLVLREATWMLGVGVVIGVGLTWSLGRVVNSLLFGITATDPASTAAAIIVLVTAGALGAWIPARRASKVDPIRALRYD
jgi:predicted permease